jgi:TolB-like protein
MVERPSRKLAVLLHADVVGSTALVQLDEALAHERIRDTFQRFADIIDSHSGIAHEIRGDALVAEFSRASDAVSAALGFQAANASHNDEIPDEVVPVVRVGIAMGEVVIADNTVTGEGIVLAQRLEQLAEPGGVCVQGAAYETMPKRLPFSYESLGEKVLKGFGEPVRVYAVTAADTVEVPENLREAVKASENTISDKPSIAVLPFTNMSGDPDQQFFADGIAEDVITALSRFHDLLVIARNSSFKYRGQSVDVRQVGHDLDVLYVLEGSVRIAGKRARITAQLVEAETGNHLWAERFDRSLEDIFEVQDEITALVASTVGQQVRIAESKSALRRGTKDLRVRDLVARAQWQIDRLTAESAAKAREICLTAIERDPQYVHAHSLLAFINIIEHALGWWRDRSPAELRADAAEAARTGIRIDPDDEAARTYLALVNFMSGKHDAAIEACETVLDINPNYAQALGALGMIYAYSGADAYERSVEYLDRAIRLSPNDPWLPIYFGVRGTAEFINGNNDAAIEWAQKGLQRNPDFFSAHRNLVCAYALKGEFEKAHEALDEFKRTLPNVSIAGYTQSARPAFKRQEDFELVVEGLRLAGVPEE